MWLLNIYNVVYLSSCWLWIIMQKVHKTECCNMAERTTSPDCYRWTMLQSLRAAHLELSSDNCQIRWQLGLLQGPAKDSSVLTLSDVEERSVTDPCPWFWILSVEMGMLKCYDWLIDMQFFWVLSRFSRSGLFFKTETWQQLKNNSNNFCADVFTNNN